MSLRICGMAFIAALACAPVSGGIITLDLLDPTGISGTAGESFEAGNSFTTAGITFTAAASTSLGSLTGSYSANSTTAGINSDGVLDEPSELDVGETLTFLLTFDDAALAVELESVDFSGIGSDALDSTLVTTTARAYALYTGQPNFNGSTDLWSPVGITFSSGDTLDVQANGLTNNVALQTMSFDITSIAVPEPISFPALLCLTACFTFRKWRRAVGT